MLLSALLKFLFCILILPTTLCSDEEDYYKLLGIDKTADLREIRKAFKKLAVQKHPDKNKDDPEAHANFVKLAEAYDTLKDPTKRNNYDLYGKQDSNNRSPPTYHSYSYYRDQFGIYDDDPLIATLSKDDMQSSIGDNIWFINFYSPLCSHCHTLAPEWRKLSELLEGVVKIGAINCEDERSLCWEISIGQFPTLLFFDERSTIYEGREYHGNRNAESMEKYIMSHISSIINVPKLYTLPNALNTPWAIFLCPNDESCSNHYTQIKLAVVLKGLVSVGYFDDENLIDTLTDGLEKPIDLLFYRREESKTIMQPLYGDDYNELTDSILHLLPEAPSLSQKDFQDARNELRIDSDKPWLLCFTLAVDTQKILTLKKLVGILDNFKIGEINCGVNSGLCNSLHIVKYPTWGILKKGGAFEIHTGKSLSLHSIERFALDTYEATNIQALSPQDVQRIMSEGTPWVIGWLLTGCPPCKKLLPALRKASNHFAPDIIQFGTVDCAVHSATCSRHNVNSFPTTQIYNASSVITFQGDSNEDSIVEFVQTMSSNYVVTLNADNFADEVQPVDKNLDAYVVEFYAPWCAPCQRLQPEWMKLAQKLSDLKNIKIGAVNCEQEINFCRSEGVNSYPTIRLYPIKITSTGGAVVKFESYNRDFASIRKWILSYLPSPIMILNTHNYNSEILSTKETRTWVIMYFAPWCGFCHTFEPEFFVAAQRLSKTVVAGKVDCQKEGALCQREGISSYPTVKLYQRIDGVTQLTNGINLDGFTQEALYTQMKTFAANAYITPVDHDEL